ncbi:hypothetical protein P5673_020330 [Acropora cervicornis]|uniref:Uncharacterized protein n=1 Tax=Acropora cervicornis TaxID=6130 RepID=A0AAD9V194_ACRCE|nr:hypothetical protein P5673_020330 [Acropora cervicornis]
MQCACYNLTIWRTGILFTIPSHKDIDQYTEQYPETVAELLKSTYVDDIQSGGDDMRGELNKWHSNILKIEESEDRSRKGHTAEDSSTYSKLTVGTRPHETRILGAAWNKDNDQLSINLTKRTEENDDGAMTKRKMLSTIHGIFDVLRIAAPVVIIGKILYSQRASSGAQSDSSVLVGTPFRWELAQAFSNHIACALLVSALDS